MRHSVNVIWSGKPDQIHLDNRDKSGADKFIVRQYFHNPIILWRQEDDFLMETDNSPNPAQEWATQASAPRNMDEYVLSRYKRQIDYYWKAAGTNKRTYKFNRTMVIVLGAAVTLLSSISSAVFIETNPWLKTIFAVATPLSAAVLTIINGFIQSFQSGAAWRDMVLNAERLEKERDRFLATPEKDRNYKRDLGILDSIVLNESTAFFKRIMDSEPEPEEVND